MMDESDIQVIWREIGDDAVEGTIVEMVQEKREQREDHPPLPPRFLVFRGCDDPTHLGQWLLLDQGVRPRHFMTREHAIDKAEVIAHHQYAKTAGLDRLDAGVGVGYPVPGVARPQRPR